MDSIKNQKEIINNRIATAEQNIATLKELVKEEKVKLKKLDKLERELQSIFNVNNNECIVCNEKIITN